MFGGPGRFLVLAARLLLGLVFIWSGFPKLLQLPEFARIVQNYQLLPDSLATPYAYGLPWLELTLGVLLLSGVLVRLAGGVSAALLLSFMLAIAISMARGTMPPDCGCFGLAEVLGSSGTETLIRDVPLLALSLLVLTGGPGPWSTFPAPGRQASRPASSRSLAAAVQVVLAVVALAGFGYYGMVLAEGGEAAGAVSPPISPTEVKERIDRGDDFLLVDVRAPDDYDAGHLPGALSLPLDELELRYPELPVDKEIVLYCDGLDCGASRAAAVRLQELGFRNIRNMEAGIEGWQEAGYPLDR